jgi:hypothetical protein
VAGRASIAGLGDLVLLLVDRIDDTQIQSYRAAGFQAVDQTARHGGGLRNGFVSFGPAYLGALCFVLTSHFPAHLRTVRGPANSVYAVSGITFVSENPEQRAGRWRDVLAPETPLLDGQNGFILGPHTLTWLTPAQLARDVGLSWDPASHPFGEIAVLHLPAEDLDRAESGLQRLGVRVTRLRGLNTHGSALLVGPGDRDGLVLAITRYPAARWSEERRARTGEELTLVTGTSATPP